MGVLYIYNAPILVVSMSSALALRRRPTARTRLNANPWELAMADGSTQRAGHWHELDWEHAAADAKAQQVETLHDAILEGTMRLKRFLGQGTFGAAFECDFPLLNSEHPLTVKLPRKLLEARLLNIVEASGQLEPVPLAQIYEQQDARSIVARKEYEHAVRSFKLDFTNFERIWDPIDYHARFSGGRLAKDVDRADHGKWLAAHTQLEAAPGRKHIHRILHFDSEIPAIFSEQCDDTLTTLRVKRSHMFRAFQTSTGWQMTDEWRRMGLQVGMALEYMKNDCGMVHTDIKLDNIFYRVTPQNTLHYMVSDFGWCFEDKQTSRVPVGTPYYSPPRWHQSNKYGLYEPITLCVYTFAVVLASCLKIPHTHFPYNLDDPAKLTQIQAETKLETFADEINYFIQDSPEGGVFFGRQYGHRSVLPPAWHDVLAILLDFNYDENKHLSNYHPLMTNLMRHLRPQHTPGF